MTRATLTVSTLLLFLALSGCAAATGGGGEARCVDGCGPPAVDAPPPPPVDDDPPPPPPDDDDPPTPADDGDPRPAPEDPGPPEVCTTEGDTAIDEDRDGSVDEGCACELAATQVCCGSGVQVCAMTGEFGAAWGPCEGAVYEDEICGDGIDQDCDGVDPPCPGVEETCATGPVVVEVQTLSFPGHGGCAWGMDGNLPETGGHYAARVEHVRSLSLPPGATLCSLDLDVPTTGMYFDDRFFFAFDEAILMSDHTPAVLERVFPREGALSLWSWGHIRGDRDHEHGLYCIGGSPCALPDTEASGSIRLDLSDAITFALSERAKRLGRYDFLVVATGDDNPRGLPEYDCKYSPFTLNATVGYVTP